MTNGKLGVISWTYFDPKPEDCGSKVGLGRELHLTDGRVVRHAVYGRTEADCIAKLDTWENEVLSGAH